MKFDKLYQILLFLSFIFVLYSANVAESANLAKNRRKHFRSPLDLQGCVLWLDAADASTITIGTGVSQWDDKSPSANHATQGTGANQPAYTTGQYLTFDGSTSYMTSTFSSALSQPATYFIVHKWNDAITNQKIMIDGIGAVNRNAIYRDASARNYAMYSNAVFNSGTLQNTDNHIIMCVFNSASSKFSIDNGAEATGNSGTLGVDGLTIGSSYAPSLFFIGNISEIIVYDSVLTAAERKQIYTYLANKWGISID